MGKNEINQMHATVLRPAIVGFRGHFARLVWGVKVRYYLCVLFSTRTGTANRGATVEKKNCAVRHRYTRGTVACTIDPEGRRQRENRIRTSEGIPVVRVLCSSVNNNSHLLGKINVALKKIGDQSVLTRG